MAQEKKPQIVMALDPTAIRMAEDLAKSDKEEKNAISTQSFILNSLKQQEVNRLAFEVDPQQTSQSYGGFFRIKNGLTPNWILKKITGPGGCETVSQIINARANIISNFGKPRVSRFTTGFEFAAIDPKWEMTNKEETEKYQDRVAKMKEILWNSGYEGLEDDYYKPNLSQYLKMVTKDGLTFGMCATEIIYKKDPITGKKSAHSFRAVDAGTIYRVVPRKETDQSIRKEAARLIAELKNEKIKIDSYEKDEYKWMQVIDGKPIQAFTEEELVVYYFYPSTGVEYNGYPVTPIDQALSSITTNLNITQHNKLYFQNGRAARGMLVFQTSDIDESTLQKIRLQFHQSINSANNSWRMPVFGIGPEDSLNWQSIDTTGRDAEFQYLLDSNTRAILSAFLISPEELPGLAHLSRGTNTQALSEGDNEYKLTAARDVGLRPLMNDIQDMFNTHILPKFDKELSDKYQFVFAGLEQDSPEKEATRLAQDIPIHMTYNEVLKRVEKTPLPKEMGADLPFNVQYQQILSSYLTVGMIKEYFFGVKGASRDPNLQYIRDPFWFQYQTLLVQKAQMALQNQMASQQMAQQQETALAQQAQQGNPPDLPKTEAEFGEWLHKNQEYMNKAIADNSRQLQRYILERHKEVVDKNISAWKNDSEKALESILSEIPDESKDE